MMEETTGDDKCMADAAVRLRAIASELDDYAWSLSIRDAGRALSHLAQHLREDAGRVELMAIMIPRMENLPPEKKAELDARSPQWPSGQ